MNSLKLNTFFTKKKNPYNYIFVPMKPTMVVLKHNINKNKLKFFCIVK